MGDYQAELHATREKTARLRALRLARDAANQGGPPAGQKDAAQQAKQRVAKKKSSAELNTGPASANRTGSH